MYISNCVCVRLVTQLCLTLCHHMDLLPTRLYCIWNFKGKTLVVHYNHFESENESHSVVSYSLGPHGLYTGVGSLPLPRGSSQLRDRAQVSCIIVRFFTS